jgi:hypothetical protein
MSLLPPQTQTIGLWHCFVKGRFLPPDQLDAPILSRQILFCFVFKEHLSQFPSDTFLFCFQRGTFLDLLQIHFCFVFKEAPFSISFASFYEITGLNTKCVPVPTRYSRVLALKNVPRLFSAHLIG